MDLRFLCTSRRVNCQLQMLVKRQPKHSSYLTEMQWPSKVGQWKKFCWLVEFWAVWFIFLWYWYSFLWYSYSYDIQYVKSFKPTANGQHQRLADALLSNCIGGSILWMTGNRLKGNDEKTDELVVHSDAGKCKPLGLPLIAWYCGDYSLPICKEPGRYLGLSADHERPVHVCLSEILLQYQSYCPHMEISLSDFCCAACPRLCHVNSRL